MTTILLIIILIMSLISFRYEEYRNKWIFNPYLVKEHGQWYRFITSGFIHGDFMHLLINMLVFWSFGEAVESYFSYVFGEKAIWYYLIMFFGALIISDLPTYFKHNNNPNYNALGASGAVSAVVFSSIVFAPMANIYLYGIIGLPGILLGLAYLGYSFYMGKKGADNINHDAHMWGAIFGFGFTIILKPSLFMHFVNSIKDAFI
jgi:membrane associated rhomboid family serine protease